MILFNLDIKNPFSDRFANLRNYSKKITEHKAVEVELLETNAIIGVKFNLTFRQDHAGVEINLALFGYELLMQLYDTRHWDSDAQDWKVYDHLK